MVRGEPEKAANMCYIPLLFYIFFAIVLTVTLSLVRADTVILVEWVLVEEPPVSMRSEPAMDYVSRAVWDILNADNACIVSRSPWGLAKMMEVIVKNCLRPDNL